MPTTSTYDKERIERVARLYHSNKDAAIALDIHPQSFGRLCRRLGVETPQRRRRRRQREELAARKKRHAAKGNRPTRPTGWPCRRVIREAAG